MLKKLSIRLRLTVLSILLLSTCCVGLTLVLNLSASRMANAIEATRLEPAVQLASGVLSPADIPSVGMEALTLSEGSLAAREQYSHQSVYYMILVVFVGGGLTYYISGRLLRPLQWLSSQMKNRTVHNLSEDLPVPESRDEVAALTVSFNEMTKKLDEAFAMQRRFSQSAAHELRTPLTVLKAKVDVFKKKKEHSPEEYDKLLAVITKHTNRLAGLVTDILDLTSMDALACDEPIELKAMLAEICEELLCISEDKNISVALLGEEKTVLGNQSLLRRAFYNLVENAIKYNKDGGTVRLFVAGDEEKGVVTLEDSGIGIPQDQRAYF